MYSFHFTGFGEPGKLAMINNSIESLKYHCKKKFQRVSRSKLKWLSIFEAGENENTQA